MTVEIKLGAMGTEDLYRALGARSLDIFRDATEEGFTASRYLEELSPTDDGDLDAFERLLQHAGIITRSNPRAGYWASPATRFIENDANRALLVEFALRQWRKASIPQPSHDAGGGGERVTYLSSDGTPGSWERPYVDAQDARWDQQLAPAIPLSELIAMTTPIDGRDYRQFYLTYDAEDLRKFRMGESAEVPIAKLEDSEQTVQLQKYGRGLEASYEALQRLRVDKLARQIQLMAVQDEIDKVAAGLDVLINGDGNTGTAASNDNISSLDGDWSAGDGLTLYGWLRFKKQWDNPYMITTALMKKDLAQDLEMLDTGSGNVPLVQIAGLGAMGTLRRINQTADGVGYGWTSDAPANKIVGFDQRFAMEYLVMVGSEISEMERFIKTQTQVITMTEWNGFSILDSNATRTLTTNT